MIKFKKEVLTSKDNPLVARVASLTEKKYRDEYGLFRTDGIKLAREAFLRGAVPELVLIRESSSEKVLAAIEETPDCDGVILSDRLFDKISDEKSPEGVICVIKHLDNFRKIATINNNGVICGEYAGEGILLLESVRDPGNLGTVLRSAAALGCERVILSSDCADVFGPKTVRASMGAVFAIKMDEYDDLPAAVGMLRASGHRVYAAALDRGAVGLDRLTLERGDCFAVGNEGHGLSSAVIDACDGKVFIPITTGAESLNAATAASILLWEMKRQNG